MAVRSERRSWRRRAIKVVLVLLALLAIMTAVAPIGRYLVRAGWAEAGILLAREPIAELVASSRVDAATRAKLQLVLRAREFAERSLRLETGESFTTFSRLGRDTLVLVLSAAHRDRLTPYTWWFPIVGRVPYKGFFDFARARAAALELQENQLDTYLRPASAFSTLGFFNDPLLSTTLALDSLSLTNTVIHELTHNTFYAKGEAVFNESFANFVGARGAEVFFRERGDSVAAARAREEWEDDKALGRFWTSLYNSLDSAFDAQADDRAARLSAREVIYARARASLQEEVGPALRTISPRALARIQLNNAALLARRVYVTDLDLFEAVYEREGRNLPRAVRRVIELARSRADDPYAAVRVWLARSGG